MPASTGPGEILVIRQVAAYLKVTERTIYRLAAARKIPAFKVGSTWRFSREDIECWIRQQSVQSDAGEPGVGSSCKVQAQREGGR